MRTYYVVDGRYKMIKVATIYLRTATSCYKLLQIATSCYKIINTNSYSGGLKDKIR